MKENVLDLLMYLFENYIYDEPDNTPDRETLTESLEEAGFSSNEIERAFAWLDELAEQRQQAVADSASTSSGIPTFPNTQAPKSCRVFSPDEVSMDDVKWVVLMVLFNQPGQEANYAWMEDLMFDEEGEYRH